MIRDHRLLLQVILDFAELFEGGFEVVDDLTGDDAWGGGLAESSRASSLKRYQPEY